MLNFTSKVIIRRLMVYAFGVGGKKSFQSINQSINPPERARCDSGQEKLPWRKKAGPEPVSQGHSSALTVWGEKRNTKMERESEPEEER